MRFAFAAALVLLFPLAFGARAQKEPPSAIANERAFAAALERARAQRPSAVDENHPDRAKPAEPRPGGELRVQLDREPPSLNYLLHAQAELGAIWDELHASLARPSLTTQALEPELATAWTVEDRVFTSEGYEGGAAALIGAVEGAWPPREGQKELVLRARGSEKPIRIPAPRVERVLRGAAITFTLREGVRWHDGAPFGVNDVRFSYECVRNTFLDAPGMSALFDMVEACEVLDGKQVRFLFAEQHFLAPHVAAALRLLPRHIYEKKGASASEQAEAVREHEKNHAFVGLGPYRFQSWDRGERIALERYSDFFGPAGFPDRIVFRFVSGPAAGQRDLLKGNLDVAVGLSGGQYTNELVGDEFTSRCVKDFVLAHRYTFIAWNLRKAPGSSRELRLALAHSFDVEGFCRTIGLGFGTRVTGHASMLGPAYDAQLVPFPFDLERARSLLEQAGWRDTDGDGLLDRNGQPLRIGFLCMSNSPPATVIGPRWKEHLRSLGVDLVLDVVDATTYDSRVQERDFDTLCMDWVTPGEVDYYPVWHSRHAAEPGSLNVAGYQNPRVDKLIEEARTTLDPETRHALWKLVQRGIYEDQPYLFLYRGATRLAWSQRWRGVVLYPERPNWRLREWFLAK